MSVTPQSLPAHRSRFAGFLLGLFLLLNAAAVLPALHEFWHAGHGCDQADCAIATLAHGGVDAAPTAPALCVPTPPPPFLLETPGSPCLTSVSDCPPIPGRAPPA